MLQALRPNPRKSRMSRGQSAPSPVEGWDAVSPLSEMDPKRAIVLDNWFPQPGYVEVRKGYTSWATGMGSTHKIETLMAYNGLSTGDDKLFGIATDGTIYDCTANSAASATSVTGLTNARWQYVNYTTSGGGCYLLCCNGLDSLRSYDGSSWSAPSISGVTSSDIININVFKKYVWGIITDSLDACYLPLDSIAGAATTFPLGSVLQKGGFLVAMATWTLDGGNGPDDYAVFISSRGQVAVYSGTDPAADFALVGVYEIPPPIGHRCFTRVAGDVAVVTIGGVVPLSKALSRDKAAEAGIALTLRINNAMNNYAQSYMSNFGWELTTFPLGTATILNIPVAENVTAIQAVMNTLTGAWCRFLGWNFNCFCIFKDHLYAGGNGGVVYQAWTGSIDDATTIDATGQTAYNFFGQPGNTKRFTAVQPNITTDQSLVPQFGLSTDFRDNAIISSPTAAIGNSALYDSAIWDTDGYAVEGRSSADWTTVQGIGQCASLHFRQSTSSTGNVTVQFNGFNVTYEVGEFY
jgi:hypothetical protein